MGDLPAPDAGKWYGRMRQSHHRCDYGKNGGTVPFPARRPSKFSWYIYIYIYITGVCFHSICSSLKMGTSFVHHHEIIQVTSKCSYLKGSMSPPKAVRKVLSLFLNALFKRFIMDMLVVPIGGFFAALQSKIGYRRLHAKHRTVSMTSQINDPHDDSIRRTEAFKGIYMDTLIVLIDGFFVAVHPDFDLLVVAARIRVRLWCYKNPAPRMTWWPWFMFWHTFTAVCCLFQSVASFFYCTALLDSHQPHF